MPCWSGFSSADLKIFLLAKWTAVERRFRPGAPTGLRWADHLSRRIGLESRQCFTTVSTAIALAISPWASPPCRRKARRGSAAQRSCSNLRCLHARDPHRSRRHLRFAHELPLPPVRLHPCPHVYRTTLLRTLGEAAYLAFRGPSGSSRCSRRLPIGQRCSPTRSSASQTRSMPFRAGNFHRRRTTCSGARAVASRRCVERTTWAMSESLLPFDDEPEVEDAGRPIDRPGPSRAASRNGRTSLTPPRAPTRLIHRRTSSRGLGRHRQDARPGRAVRQPAARGCRAGPHPGDHVYAQGRGRDAPAHHRAAEGSEPPLAVRRGALARPEGAARGHRDLHHRRVLHLSRGCARYGQSFLL